MKNLAFWLKIIIIFNLANNLYAQPSQGPYPGGNGSGGGTNDALAITNINQTASVSVVTNGRSVTISAVAAGSPSNIVNGAGIKVTPGGGDAAVSITNAVTTNVYNLEDYGAVIGAADNSVALSNCIVAAISGRGKVHISGAYNLTHYTPISNMNSLLPGGQFPYLVIEGNGFQHSRLTMTATNQSLFRVGSGGIELSGIALVGPGPDVTTNCAIEQITGVGNSLTHIHDCYITLWGTGIFGHMQDGLIENNFFDQNGYDIWQEAGADASGMNNMVYINNAMFMQVAGHAPTYNGIAYRLEGGNGYTIIGGDNGNTNKYTILKASGGANGCFKQANLELATPFAAIVLTGSGHWTFENLGFIVSNPPSTTNDIPISVGANSSCTLEGCSLVSTINNVMVVRDITSAQVIANGQGNWQETYKNGSTWIAETNVIGPVNTGYSSGSGGFLPAATFANRGYNQIINNILGDHNDAWQWQVRLAGGTFANFDVFRYEDDVRSNMVPASSLTGSASGLTGTTLSGLTASTALVANGSKAITSLANGGANTVLHGTTGPAYSAVVEGDLGLTDITTANVSTTAHGFTPKLPNDSTKYLDGTGAYSVPSGGGGSSTNFVSGFSGQWINTNTMTTSNLNATNINILPPANSQAFAISNFSLTGSSAQGIVRIDGTGNTSGSPDIISLHYTNTASGGSLKLINVYGGAAGNTTEFSLDPSGTVTISGTLNANAVSATSMIGGVFRGSGNADFAVGSSTTSRVNILGTTTGISGTLSITNAEINLGTFTNVGAAGFAGGLVNNGTFTNTGASRLIGAANLSTGVGQITFGLNGQMGCNTATNLLMQDIGGGDTMNVRSAAFIGTVGFITPFTYTTAGTTGNQTINKPSGSVRIAAAGTTVTLTDNLITANSIVIPVMATVDTTAKSVASVVGSGSCVFTLNAAATAEVEIRFVVWNESQ